MRRFGLFFLVAGIVFFGLNWRKIAYALEQSLSRDEWVLP